MTKSGPRATTANARAGAKRRARAATGRAARPTIAVALLLAGLLLATAFVALAVQRNAMARETAALRADIIAQQSRQAGLEAALAEKAGDSYVVDKARAYGYVKPGEALIGVRSEPTAAPVVAAAPAPSRADRWIALFFGTR